MAKTKAKDKKKPTLQEFVATFPSQAEAAREICVAEGTLNNWLNDHQKPTGLSLTRLESLGVDISLWS